MNMTNKLILPVESRMQGDLHVRFGGRLWETYHRKVARRPLPSLHNTDPDPYTPRYTVPLEIPEGATWLKVVTYRNGKPSGKMITITTKELRERAK